MLEAELVVWSVGGHHDSLELGMESIFRCGLASLQDGMFVRPLVRPSVGPLVRPSVLWSHTS